MVIQGLGFDQPCSGSLACGHKCPFPNHPPDFVHEYPLCFEQCRQRCSGCGMQSCQKLCYEACEQVCYETIQKHLPCGHKQTTLCYEPVEDTHCDARCGKELVCGHACIKPCSEECQCDYAVLFSCTTCKKKTYQCSSLDYCTRKCDVKLPCGHQCSNQCGDHMTHSKVCKKICSRPCQFCNKSTCTRKCGECKSECPPCSCRMQQIQLNCGHVTYGFAGSLNDQEEFFSIKFKEIKDENRPFTS
ncbi:unnamed protein product [Oikopleura dioica]|uniref:Uncharacterized protein n=1 Tax=Oikopleura dioica TaxID=34765 RepID=E4YNL1_OIKDI|nr:unnamed protein product [Oikopleura dioica]